MDDSNIIIGSDGAVRFHCSKSVNTGSGFTKTIKSMRKIFCAALFVVLPWNAYAAADRFPGAQAELDGLENAATPLVENLLTAVSPPVLDQAEVIIPDGAGLAVNAAGENAPSVVVNQELASLDIQDSQPASIVSRETATLEVVDTGTSRHVQNPQPVAVEPTGAEAPSDNLLPMTDVVAEKNEMASAAVEETGRKNGQPDEDTSSGAVSEEVVQVPYAVLLAILALMSMIPVARRNG